MVILLSWARVTKTRVTKGLRAQSWAERNNPGVNVEERIMPLLRQGWAELK